MSKYEVGVTPFAMLDWEQSRVCAQPYLLCLDCGELWVQVAGKVHELKREHSSVCPAEIQVTKLAGYVDSPATYSTLKPGEDFDVVQ